ncbi:hypothetical protein J4Q44_G00208770 [Coregonus suidteri]|uniref:Uncharacterized protein n=1 Tax=Coregonus suidteri TaxID=861788 RepID=A0AAN8LHC1_9TELE
MLLHLCFWEEPSGATERTPPSHPTNSVNPPGPTMHFPHLCINSHSFRNYHPASCGNVNVTKLQYYLNVLNYHPASCGNVNVKPHWPVITTNP